MTNNTDDVWGEPEVPRDRWSRPMIVPPNGGKAVAYTRCTTFAGAIEDTYNLSKWQQRMVALGLAERRDLLLSVAAHHDDKDELNRICETALEAAKGKAAAGVGTALHKLTDRLDRGEPLGPVPPEYQGDLAAFAEATKPLKVMALERFVVCDELKIGGTFDRLYEYDGQLYIGDTKSGSIEYGAGKIAMQLAIYSRSVLYDPKTKTRTPLNVDQDRAIVVHLPAGQGKCELKWVNIQAGWEAGVQLAADVRKWRSRKGLIVDFAAFRMPVVAADTEPAAEPELAPVIEMTTEAQAIANLTEAFGTVTEVTLTDQIDGSTSNADLEALWSNNRAAWTDGHTAAAKKRKQHLHQQSLRDAVDAA